jgi:hypothetical protein
MPGWMPESCGLYELFTQLTGDHGAGRQSDRAGQLRMRSSWLVVCGLRQKSPGCGLSGRGKGGGLRSWNRKSGSQRSQATNHPLKLAGDLGLDVTGGNSAPAFMRTCSTLRGRADHERCGAMRLVSSRHPAGTARTTSPKRANILSTRHTDAGPRRALRSIRNRPRTATRFRADVHHCSGVIGAARLRKN